MAVLLNPLSLSAQNQTNSEYRTKANYIAKFPSFVEWPADAISPGQTSFLICVLGDYPFGISLSEMTGGRSFHNHRYEVHFKQVNDTCGHLAGDEVLRETARRLLDSVRSYDFVGRYGGEEFLIVLSNCNSANGLTRAEDIRKAIGERPIETPTGPVPVTISIGLLLAQEWGLRPADVLLREVDAALYAAKGAGRNCVKVARPDEAIAHHMPPLREPARQHH